MGLGHDRGQRTKGRRVLGGVVRRRPFMPSPLAPTVVADTMGRWRREPPASGCPPPTTLPHRGHGSRRPPDPAAVRAERLRRRVLVRLTDTGGGPLGTRRARLRARRTTRRRFRGQSRAGSATPGLASPRSGRRVRPCCSPSASRTCAPGPYGTRAGVRARSLWALAAAADEVILAAHRPLRPRPRATAARPGSPWGPPPPSRSWRGSPRRDPSDGNRGEHPRPLP